MGYHTKLPIVTDGLIFSVDPYNTKSYVSGDTTTYDLTKNKYSGTLQNGVGFSNDSWSFDGSNQSIDFGSLDALNLGTDSFTITSWAKLPSDTTTRTILAKRVSSGTFVGYQLRCNTTGALGVYIDGGTPAANRQSATSIQDNTWHYICAVVDRGVNDEMLLYMDGKLDTTGTSAFSPSIVGSIDNAANLYIGEMDGIHFLQGIVSDTKLYNKVLTPSEVLQNYNALKYRFV
jgi:hypothetical protein